MPVNEVQPSQDYAALRRDPEYGQLNQRLLEFLALGGPRRLLDIGCGDGAVSEVLLGRDPGLALTGVDPEPGLLAEARARLEGRAEFHVGDAASVERLFPPASFDSVVMANCVHLVEELPAALGAIHRVLEPGGRLVFNSAFYAGAELPAELPVYAELIGAARRAARARGLVLDRSAPAKTPGMRRSAEDYWEALAACGFTGITHAEESFTFSGGFLAALCGTPMFASAALPGIDRNVAAELLRESLQKQQQKAPVTVTRRCLYFSAVRA